MFDIKVLNLSIDKVFIRFFVAMLGGIAIGFAGQFVLAAIFAFAMLFVTILGITIEFSQPKAVAKNKSMTTMIPMKRKTPTLIRKAS